jgi:hypothetical protein
VNTARSKILVKIVKLQRLARDPSANPNEAESSKVLAERLMLEHGVSQSEVDEASGFDRREVDLGLRGWSVMWRFALVTAAARHCGAEAMARRVGNTGRRVSVVGKKANVERALSLHAGLLRVARKLRKEARERFGTEWKRDMERGHDLLKFGQDACLDDFSRGVVRGIVEVLRRPTSVSFGSVMSTPSPVSTGTALVRASSSSTNPQERPRVVQEKLSRTMSEGWSRLGRLWANERISLGKAGEVDLRAASTYEQGLDDFFWA